VDPRSRGAGAVPSRSDWGPLLKMVDEAAVHGRPDVATFTAALPCPVLAGPVVAHLVVDADAPSTHVVIRLHDSLPGRADALPALQCGDCQHGTRVR